MSTILVIGTCAIDYIGSYQRSFAELPTPKALNLSLQLQGLRKAFGGCAMNIAVMLHRLGHQALPFATIGGEFDDDYQSHLDDLGIDQRGLIRSSPGSLSSHALILTDPEDNQFTAFYPGEPKTNFREDLERFLDSIDANIDGVFLAPDEPEYMLVSAEVCRSRNLAFICDPGQCTTAFTADDCATLVNLAANICFNRYEHEIFASHVEDLDDQLDVVIVTQGADGVRMKINGQWHHERAAKPRRHIDPTGCGDAFRAGLIHALSHSASWPEAIRAGCTLATINIEHVGTQVYDPTELEARFQSEWQVDPSWLEPVH